MPGNSQKATPFQEDKNWNHHWRSRWNSVFKRMGWSRLRKQRSRSIMRRKNLRPGQTTFAAWCKWPIRDSNWRLVHQRRVRHEWISSCKAQNLSSGRQATWAMQSNLMPSTSKQEDGSIHLSGWRGSPNTLQAANDFAILSAHWLESGGLRLWSHLNNASSPRRCEHDRESTPPCPPQNWR